MRSYKIKISLVAESSLHTIIRALNNFSLVFPSELSGAVND